jgi:hypothetical protein
MNYYIYYDSLWKSVFGFSRVRIKTVYLYHGINESASALLDSDDFLFTIQEHTQVIPLCANFPFLFIYRMTIAFPEEYEMISSCTTSSTYFKVGFPT